MNQPPWGAPPTYPSQYTQPAYQPGYAPAWGQFPIAPMGQAAWACGDILVVPLFAPMLPPVCPKTGEPTSSSILLKMQWNPPWVYLLLLMGVIPFALVSMAVQKRAQIQMPLAQRVINRRRNGYIVGIGGFMLFLVMLIGGASAGSPEVAFLSFAVFIGSLVYMIWAVNLFKVHKITDHHALLRGISPSYLQSFPQGPLPPGAI